jgi:WD40 repeat protein
VVLDGQGKTAITGSIDKTVKVWDVPTGKCLSTLANQTCYPYLMMDVAGVTALTYYPFNQNSRCVKQWSLSQSTDLATTHTLSEGPVACMAANADLSQVAALCRQTQDPGSKYVTRVWTR